MVPDPVIYPRLRGIKMNVLWLLVGTTPPAEYYPGVTCLWCPPSAAPGQRIRGDIFVPPGGEMAPLCRAFYALAACGHTGPVMVSSGPSLPGAWLSGQPVPKAPLFRLTGPDEGTLYWPAATDFIRHTGSAIREHDPACGPILLEAAWHQALLDAGEAQE